jgi:mersacidin/lichenicidin family type 2 lantibiotic
MSTNEIIRAWKDAEYRASLSEAARAALPAHPAGSIDLPGAGIYGARGMRLRTAIKAGIRPTAATCNC